MIWGENPLFSETPISIQKQPAFGTMGLPFTTAVVAGSYDSKGYDKGSNSKGGYDSKGYIPISTAVAGGGYSPRSLTASFLLKNDGWKMSPLLGRPIFRVYVKLPGGMVQKSREKTTWDVTSKAVRNGGYLPNITWWSPDFLNHQQDLQLYPEESFPRLGEVWSGFD